MLDLLNDSLVVYVLPATTILAICVIYWLFVILGTLDIDTLDFAPELDADIDLDLDADADADAQGAESANSWFSSLIDFFNLVEIPAIVFLTVKSICWWFLMVTLDAALNPAGAVVIGLGLAVGTLIVSLFVAKFVTQPFKPFFKRLNQGEAHIEIVGSEATVKTSQVDEKFGQIVIEKDGSPLILNARTAEGAPPISKDEKVIVYREKKKDGIYFIRKI